MSNPIDIEQLREAIENEGRAPRLHREIMARHRREWPTLWKAIDALLDGEVIPRADILRDTVAES